MSSLKKDNPQYVVQLDSLTKDYQIKLKNLEPIFDNSLKLKDYFEYLKK